MISVERKKLRFVFHSEEKAFRRRHVGSSLLKMNVALRRLSKSLTGGKKFQVWDSRSWQPRQGLPAVLMQADPALADRRLLHRMIFVQLLG